MSTSDEKSGKHPSWLDPSTFFLGITCVGLALLVAIAIYWAMIPHHG